MALANADSLYFIYNKDYTLGLYSEMFYILGNEIIAFFNVHYKGLL